MFRRILGPFKEFGLWVGSLYLLDRLLRSISPSLGLYVYEMLVQPITGKPMLSANLAKNLAFHEIGPEHPDLSLMPTPEDVTRSRFTQGARCLGAYRKGQLVGYIWLVFGRYGEDEVRCSYELGAPSESVFDFDLYVLPEHRMGIAFMAIWHGANQYLFERGVRYSFSRMTRFNLPSRRAHARLGARCVCSAIVVKIGVCELVLADMAPFVHLSWRSSQRAQLRLWPNKATALGDASGEAHPARVPADRPNPGSRS